MKSNYRMYKDSNLKSKLKKNKSANESSEKKLINDKLANFSKMSEYRKTEFIIPKNLSKKTTEYKDNLSRYLKDNPNVQSHTIHINELLNSTRKKVPKTFNKGFSVSTGTSLSRIKGHKRVKSNHTIHVSIMCLFL